MSWGQIWRKKLRMVWRVRKHVLESFLVGTAHFSQYSFKKSLTNLLRDSEHVLFEGPLDPSSMEKVVAAGTQGQDFNTILDELDEKTLGAMVKVLGLCTPEREFSLGLQRPLFTPKSCLEQALGAMRPWMTFFSIYSAYLQKKGWRYSVDMEAYAIANKLGKNIVFMETIEDQIEVLETLSREQIADFLRRIDSWPTYTSDFMRWYLKGDLAKIARNPYSFPTRNPWVIERRDAIFCEKMQPYLERGGAAVFVGIPHITGVRRILTGAGYAVDQD